MYGYTFFTWLIANLIHPVILIIYFGGMSGFFDSQLIQSYVFIFFYSLFISSGSLLISFLVIYILLQLNIPIWCKFLCWLIIAPLVVIANLFVFGFILGGNGIMTLADAEIAIPAMLSVTVVILIRYNYFIRVCEAARTEKAEEEC